MSEFSLPIVFVVPVSNALPTTGSTQNLVDGKFGVFKDDARTIATNGNIATAAYIQFFQGRPASIGPILGTKQSDKIKTGVVGTVSGKVKKWYKAVGSTTAANQITTVGAFDSSLHCGESLTLSIVAHSSYIDALSFNGFVRSVTIKTPCCDCGADPCTTVDNEAVIDLILAQIAADSTQVGAEVLNIGTFMTFAKTGTGTTAVLTITGKALTTYAQPCDIAANPFEYDRMWFRVYAYKATPTLIDFQVEDSCEQVATVTVTQRSKTPFLTSAEVAQFEKNYYSYDVASHKHLFRNSGYNQFFTSYVTAGLAYDQYTIIFEQLQQDNAWSANQLQDETVHIFFPTTEGATVETMLTTYLGAPEVKTPGTITTSPLVP